jgi:hypothetical protein
MRVVMVVAVVVTMTKTMMIKTGLPGMKIAMISIPHHFMPHLVVNHMT